MVRSVATRDAQRLHHGRHGERLLTLTLAIVLDGAFGEPPPSLHPVVGIGKLAGLLERGAPATPGPFQVVYGGGMVALMVGTVAGVGMLVERLVGRSPRATRLAAGALLVKPAFAVRELLAGGECVREPLARGDLAVSRTALRGMVSRDPTSLSAPLIAAAAIESLAENASDSIVAPWLAYVIAGLPGVYAYRAVNTLDAMIGYRGQYEYLGKCAARLDDLLNLVPARLTAGLIVLSAGINDGDARAALVVARRDHAKTASPNAGWPMSAMAGALGVQLEKVGHYRLGDSRRTVQASDVAAAGYIVRRLVMVGVLALVVFGGSRILRRHSKEAA
jgi:adenosylcobinamide-phosphate synthase